MVHKVQSLNGSIVQFKRKHRQYISKIHAIATKQPHDMKTTIQNLIKQNKKEYNSDFVKLTTQVSQIGQISFTTAAKSITTIFNFLTETDNQSWISASTISRWHKEVSELHIKNIFQQNDQSNYFTLGIIADESGRGEKKVFLICLMIWNSIKNIPDIILLETKELLRCNSDTITQALIETCADYNIDTKKCLTFLSDNINYMSG